jgi:hypothetical protein
MTRIKLRWVIISCLAILKCNYNSHREWKKLPRSTTLGNTQLQWDHLLNNGHWNEIDTTSLLALTTTFPLQLLPNQIVLSSWKSRFRSRLRVVHKISTLQVDVHASTLHHLNDTLHPAAHSAVESGTQRGKGYVTARGLLQEGTINNTILFLCVDRSTIK